MKTEEMNKTQLEMNDVVAEYENQTDANEDVHFEHVDWTYSDSSCCC